MDYYGFGKSFKSMLALNEKAINRIKHKLGSAPKGSLSIRDVGNGRKEYYNVFRENGKQKSIYIGKNNFQTARVLAQKAYDFDVMEMLEEEKKVLIELCRFYPEKKFKLYEQLPAYRQKLVEPFFIYSNDGAKRWAKQYSNTNKKNPEELKFYTKKGEARRSKAERDISNYLDEHADELIYVYEPYVKLSVSGRIVCPDFVILNKKTGRVFYWEHFGGFGIDNYINDFVKKMQDYTREDRDFWNNLITTYENKEYPLQDYMIQNALDKILKI